MVRFGQRSGLVSGQLSGLFCGQVWSVIRSGQLSGLVSSHVWSVARSGQWSGLVTVNESHSQSVGGSVVSSNSISLYYSNDQPSHSQSVTFTVSHWVSGLFQ